MNLCHRSPNLYLLSSLSLLGLVTLGNPNLAIAEISEPTTVLEALATDTELSKEISRTSNNVGNALEKVEQSELYRAGDAPSCSLKEAIASCSKAGTDELHFDALTPTAIASRCPFGAIASGGARSAIAQTTLEDIPQEPTLTLEGQVTSVNQLRDVQPTDWAFEALRSLIERYGVIAGYPDGTFRGNRAMTRYEFAAALNAALERINELIAATTAQQVSRDDLATLQRLQEEFATELATLRGRVDRLEARTAELEANQFSTTTKLTGQVIMAVNGGGFEGNEIISPTGTLIADEDPNPTVLYRASLFLNTSFSGTDTLTILIETRNNGARDNAAGVLEPNFGSVLDFSVKPPRSDDFGLGRVYYTFRPLQDLTVSLGPDIRPTDYVDRNSYANLGFRDFTTLAFTNNYILFPVNGPSAGAAIDWNPGGGAFKVRAVYAAAEAGNPGSQGFVRAAAPFTRLLYPAGGGDLGLFGDTYQGMAELEYSPTRAFALRLQYSGGQIFDRRFDVFGANLELALSPQFAVFGRYGLGSYDDTAFGDVEPNYWMAGVALRDLFKPGALAGIAAGQPFIEGAVGNATQTNFEAFYNYPVTNNITVTPLVQVITNAGNQDSNGTIFTGTLRTVFSF
jgi:porin